MTNYEWLLNMSGEERQAWFDAEHVDSTCDNSGDFVTHDSREKLEADLNQYVLDAWAQGWEAGQHDDMDCNFYVSDMRSLLDRQAAITERECMVSPGYTPDYVHGLEAKVNSLVAENGDLEWRELHFERKSSDLQAKVDELEGERDYWKGQVLECLICACKPGGYSAGVMSYPLSEGFMEPSLLVTDVINSLRDFYADIQRENAKLSSDELYWRNEASRLKDANESLGSTLTERCNSLLETVRECDRYRELWIAESWHSGYQRNELARLNAKLSGHPEPINKLVGKDGKPIRRGQILYGEDGRAWKVDRYDGHYLWTENDEKRLRPEWLTHEKPEQTDSFDLLVNTLRSVGDGYVLQKSDCSALADRIEKLAKEGA